MLNLTKQTDYAFLFVSYLSNKKDRVSLSEIVKVTKLPQRFLARIAADLAKVGIVESFEGKDGGYLLTKKVNDFSLYEFLKLFEGELNFVECSEDGHCCQYESICSQKNFLGKVLNKILIKELKKWKLVQVIK
jgi:Rrf2 family protein